MAQPEKQMDWCIRTYCLAPLDHLLQRLQWLDERQHCLYECLEERRSPFKHAARQLARILLEPCSSGPLATMVCCFTSQGEESKQRFLRMVLQLVLGEIGHLRSRFNYFAEWPFALLRMAHVQHTPAQRLEVCRAFMDANACCKSTEFGNKVGKVFTTAAELANSTEFWDLVCILEKEYRVCNMHTERQLARIRASDRHLRGAPLIERVRAGGFMSEIVTEHVRQGGSRPGLLDRAGLLEAGVPLRRAAKIDDASRPPSGFAAFCGKQEESRKSVGPCLTDCGGRKARFRALSQNWMAKPQHEKDSFAASAKAAWAHKQAQSSREAPDRVIGSDWF